MRTFSLFTLSVLILTSIPSIRAVAADTGPATSAVRLRFADTDVSDVLQALSLKTHAGIVFPAHILQPISINITASSVEEALRYVTAAAGLAFRKAGNVYVVATPANMKQALAGFGEHVLVSPGSLTPDTAVKQLEASLPYLTASPAGDKVMLVGASEDIERAKQLLMQTGSPVSNTVKLARLMHASVTQTASLLRSLYPDIHVETVAADSGPGGVLGLNGPGNQVADAEETLKKVDSDTQAQAPEDAYKIYHVRYSSAQAIIGFLKKSAPDIKVWAGPADYTPPNPQFNPITGVPSAGGSSSGMSSSSSTGGGMSSSVSSPAGGSSSAASSTTNDHTTTLVMMGTPIALDSAMNLLKEVDVAPRQVMIDVKVIDTSPEDAQQLGLTWNWSNLNITDTPAGTPISTAPGASPLSTTRPLHFSQFSRLPIGLQVTLNAMITHKQAKVLADPRIQVLDNTDASIFIGDTIRTQVSQAGLTGATVQVLEFPVGIILLVHPRINPNGQITMQVHPVVSTITGFSANNLPQSSSREADTTVRVQDGQTMVIGGLISDEISKTVQEVPILSKLPLIGQLFRSTSTDHRHSEVLIFITPHIITH